MLLREEREQIVHYGKIMVDRKLTVGTFGNISVYNRDLDLFAITPSGFDYYKTSPEDCVILRPDGTIVEGDRKPSSEYLLHSAFYREDFGVQAVVHTHSMYCTILACMGEPLRAVHYAIAEAGTGEIPLVPYHTFGTPELAEAAAAALRKKSRGLILANHGMCAGGSTLKSAYGLALTMEWCARVQLGCLSAGKMNVLTDEQMAEAMEHYKTYGQVRKGGAGPMGYNG